MQRPKLNLHLLMSGKPVASAAPDDHRPDDNMPGLTFARLTGDGVTGWAVFGAHSHIASNFVCWREVERADGRVDLVWSNPSVFGPDAIRNALRVGNERVGIDTCNHSRPALWCRVGKDATATIAPRIILEGDVRDRILDLVELMWKAPEADDRAIPFAIEKGKNGNWKVVRKVSK